MPETLAWGKRLRPSHWSLRTKAAMLLVVASVVPLGASAYMDIRDARRQALGAAAALLSARADQVAAALDGFNQVYATSVARSAQNPALQRLCRASVSTEGPLQAAALATISQRPRVDPTVRGTALLDSAGVVRVATEGALVGVDLSFHGYVKRALAGGPLIPDLHVAEPQVGSVPTIAHIHPIRRSDGSVGCFVAMFVRAESLWSLAKSSNDLGGRGSFSVLLDEDGVRIAHTYNPDSVFHPAGRLSRSLVDAMVAERRFGDRTRALLDGVRPFPEQFERARRSSPSGAVFRGLEPVSKKWSYGVARRLETAPWTLFYKVPEATLLAPIDATTRSRSALAMAILLAALLVGALFARTMLVPIASLSHATEAIAAGDLSARVPDLGIEDELGRLGRRFNAMAGQIESQAKTLRQARDSAEDANAELEAFSYSVAHDLRSPLRAIHGFSTALLEDWGERLDEEATGHLRRVMAGAVQMSHLIDALLALARLSRTDIRHEPVDLTRIGHEIFAHRRAADPGRTVEVVVAPGLVAHGDGRLLRALLENLLGNAWKFTARRPDGRIELGSEVVDGVTAFFVRDNGAGFPMEQAGLLFAPFRRLHTTAEFEGIGVGLATVQRIVRRHGGRVWAEAEVGRGATFRFTLG